MLFECWNFFRELNQQQLTSIKILVIEENNALCTIFRYLFIIARCAYRLFPPQRLITGRWIPRMICGQWLIDIGNIPEDSLIMMMRILFLLLLRIYSLGQELSEYISHRLSIQLVTALLILGWLGNVQAQGVVFMMKLYILIYSSHFFRYVTKTRRLTIENANGLKDNAYRKCVLQIIEIEGKIYILDRKKNAPP